MVDQRSSPAEDHAPPPLWLGVLTAAGTVAATTALIEPLSAAAPIRSLAVIYLLPVLLVASLWGGLLAYVTALASAAVFNWFHLPPTGRFELSAEDWVGVGVLLVAALVATTLAERGRARAVEAHQRRAEAELTTDLARMLLGGERLGEALQTASVHLAQALGLARATITLAVAEADAQQVAFVLAVGDDRVGTLLVPASTSASLLARIERHVAGPLSSLVAVARARDDLLDDVVETAALRRSDVLKTSLLRAVSHDLRSPLTAILTAGEALRSPSVVGVEHDEVVDDITAAAARLSRLVDKLLDLSQLEARAIAPQMQWCSLTEVIEAAIEQQALPPEGFSLSIDGDLPEVRADAAQLERAFANLLENAERYSGGHPVSVRSRQVGQHVVVRVVDRGPGIAPRAVERIFEPFYRVDAAASEHRGAGLGLAIARGFVEVNGGKLWAESVPGQGTTFVVQLPVELRADAGVDRPERAPARASG